MAENLEIAVISLETATERRKLINEQLQSLSRPWSFFDAHTSLANPAITYDEAHVRRCFGRTLSPAERAVWSSHISVVERFLNEGTSDYLLVLEDDVIYDTAFPLQAITDLCKERQIHYLRLFGMYHVDAVRLGFFFDRSIIRYKSSPAGTQAYLVSKEGAKRLVEHCRDMESTIDLAMDAFWKTGLPLYAVFPFPIIERFAPSTIPMQDPGQLSQSESRAWVARRIHNRLSKLKENSRLRASDRSFQRAAMAFKQIGAEDLGQG